MLVKLALGDLALTLSVDALVAEDENQRGNNTGRDEAKLETVAELVARSVLLSVKVGCHGLLRC